MSASYTIPASEIRLGEHHCARAVVSCIDFRFREYDQKFIASLSSEPFDHIKVAGVAKNFLKEPNRQMLVDTLRNVCCGLHAVKEIIVLNHWDCGGYGFSKAFASPQAEEQAHANDLRAAGQVVQQEFPDLKVTLAYSKVTDAGLEYFILD